MVDVVKTIFWLLVRRVVARSRLEADLVALGHQVSLLRRQLGHRPKLTRWDRLFFSALYHVQPDVLQSILIVRPETVVRWHRAGFRLIWKVKSRGKAGRPSVPADVRRLIREISIANPLWGAPRNTRGVAESRDRYLAVDRRELHGSRTTPSVSGMADVPAQPCPRHCRHRPVRRADHRLQASVRLGHSGP